MIRLFRNTACLLVQLSLFFCVSGMVEAQEEEQPVARLNLKTKTLGGKQFWTDVRLHRDWRIQQHALTDHYRLISDKRTRHAWGSFAHCEAEFNKAIDKHELTPRSGKFVVLLHGLTRSRSAMKPIKEFLQRETDCHVVNFSYASTRASLSEHAAALRQVVENLEDAKEISFIGHSMGNMVVRHYLKDISDPKTGELSDKRLHRMVMIGPPNNGAELARKFEKFKLFKVIYGKSGQELGDSVEELSARLATPPFEFGIIAGSGTKIANPLLEGENDFVVSVEEAKLAGAADFYTTEGLHTLLVNSEDVHRACLNFIDNGWFISKEDRKPLTAEDMKSTSDEATDPDANPSTASSKNSSSNNPLRLRLELKWE